MPLTASLLHAGGALVAIGTPCSYGTDAHWTGAAALKTGAHVGADRGALGPGTRASVVRRSAAVRGIETGTGAGVRPHRASSRKRNTGTVALGVSAGASGRLSLHGELRSL
jgi:hypothetical protein